MGFILKEQDWERDPERVFIGIGTNERDPAKHYSGCFFHPAETYRKQTHLIFSYDPVFSRGNNNSKIVFRDYRSQQYIDLK